MAYRLLKPRGRHPYYVARITLPNAAGIVTTTDRSTKCRKRGDARRVAERLHAEVASGARREPLEGALQTLIGLRVKQRRAQATIEKLDMKAAQLIVYFGADRDVNGLRLRDTSAYVAHRRAQGIADSTIAMELGTLRAALRYLRKLERYDRDPGALWPEELPHGSGVGERWLTWSEYLSVLQAMAPEFRDALTLYVACGLRFSELYGLRASDLHDTGEGYELHVRGTKTDGARRAVAVNPDALEALQRRAQAAPQGALFPMRRKGLPSQKAAWARALSAACRAARVPDASTNDLRRTFATWACDRGVPEHVVAGWLGHAAKSQMLRRVYLRLTAGTHAREGAKLLSRRTKVPETAEAKEG